MIAPSDEHLATIRQRLATDIEVTLDSHGVPMWGGWQETVDALVEDAMHPLEKLVAELRHENLVLGRG